LRLLGFDKLQQRKFPRDSDHQSAFDKGAVFKASASLTPMSRSRPTVKLRAEHCVLTIERPRPRVVLVTFVGRDVGELGDAPFEELAHDFAEPGAIELFIDARGAKSASMDVSGSWAVWLGANGQRFEHVSMLTGSRFIQLTAEFVKNFAALGAKMRLYTEADAFEAALRRQADSK
jgi:hypothetical protein